MVEAASGVSFDGWCDGRIFAARHGPHELASRRARSNGDRHALPLEGRGVRGVRTVRLSGRSAPDDRPRTRVTSARSWRSASSTASGSSTRTPVREMRRTQFPDVAHGQGLIWYRFALRGMPLMGHNGGDSGVATQMYFRPSDGVGVIALSNGNWRRDGSGWPCNGSRFACSRKPIAADQSKSPMAIRFRRSMTRSMRSGSRSVSRARCASRNPRTAAASTARLNASGSTRVLRAAR
jgi:hypothetical protein